MYRNITNDTSYAKYTVAQGMVFLSYVRLWEYQCVRLCYFFIYV